MLYRIALYTPDPYERCHNRAQTRTVGTLRAAKLAAKALLKPHARYETTYSARVNRYPWVVIERPDGSRVTDVEPTLTYVPSVGDLGYW